MTTTGSHLDLLDQESMRQVVSPPSTPPLAADDANSLEALFERAYPRLVRSLTVGAGDRQSAEEAVQEAFVQAHLKWNRIQHYDSPEAWVRRVAVNRLHNMRRSRTRGRDAVDRLAVHEAAAPDADRLDLDVMDALSQLPSRQRMAAALYYLDDLSVAQIAEAMGVAAGSVSQHLDRAREKLGRQLRSHRYE